MKQKRSGRKRDRNEGRKSYRSVIYHAPCGLPIACLLSLTRGAFLILSSVLSLTDPRTFFFVEARGVLHPTTIRLSKKPLRRSGGSLRVSLYLFLQQNHAFSFSSFFFKPWIVFSQPSFSTSISLSSSVSVTLSFHRLSFRIILRRGIESSRLPCQTCMYTYSRYM